MKKALFLLILSILIFPKISLGLRYEGNVSCWDLDVRFSGGLSIGYDLDTGDVNGDGIDDLIIAGKEYWYNEPREWLFGRIFIIFGGEDFLLRFDDPDEWYDMRASDNHDVDIVGGYGDDFGYSVSCIGDVNGDGIDDILVGYTGWTLYVPTHPGKAYLIYGRRNWDKKYNVEDIADHIFGAENNLDFRGLNCGYLGDVNGDGLKDFMIGAPSWPGDCSDYGRAYLFYGRREGNYPDLAHADVVYTGEGSMNWLGFCCRTAGDINGDSCDDFMIGAPQYPTNYNDIRGRIYLYTGHELEIPTILSSFTSSDYYWITSYLGEVVSPMGDLNGDELDEIGLGANDWSYFFTGKNTGWKENYFVPEEYDFTIEPWGLYFGRPSKKPGDIDGDGKYDLMVSQAAYNSHYSQKIDVFINYWDSTIPNPIDQVTINFGGSKEYGPGYQITHGGDINNDGIDDIIIGDPSDIQGHLYIAFTEFNIPPTEIHSLDKTASDQKNTDFINIGDTIYLQLMAEDADPSMKNVAEAQAISDSDPHGIKVRLYETELNSGIFNGKFRLTDKGSSYMSRRLRVRGGDQVTVYSRADENITTTFYISNPSVTPTPTPTATPTSQPIPRIRLAGYWNTRLETGIQGTLKIKAFAFNDDLTNLDSVELYYQGIPTGIFMYDNGTNGDVISGDGFYSYHLDFIPEEHGHVLLEIIGKSGERLSDLWPYLVSK